MNATTVPSKATIQGSFQAASTTRTKFWLWILHPQGQGKTARTVDSAKTALVAYFRDLKVDPNPARDVESKQYVVGLQKYNKKNNIDDEKKAHPLSVHELSCLVNSLSTSHLFVGAMYRFLLSASYLGCFRISEMLNLTWDDVAIKNDGDSQYVSIRLRWHKKASVQSDCQIYHLVVEKSFPCLRVCGLFGDYVNFVKRASPNLATKSFVFPAYTIEANGTPKLNWYKHLDQNQVRLYINDAVQKCSELPTGITLHSMRRGGSFYRVFESPERRFNFRELMAWCRWEDAKTCCEYLITRSITSEVDPRNLLRVSAATTPLTAGMDAITVQDLSNTIVKMLREAIPSVPVVGVQDSVSRAVPVAAAAKSQRQTTLDVFVSHVIVPTARSAQDAWNQWFTGDPHVGLFQPLRSFNRQMIRADRRKYSERLTLSLAFSKYVSFEMFEAAYAGHTSSYSNTLIEVRKRKREGRL
ncbi:hypothetical protein AaE_013279 [Aphanomyces astaci]|uniref:Uncharacterized protein n=1 Tax=Aphanomyces astaci TaxID=112090 RepID=A0A6A4ZB94_APHAT|nr:hypothetical protein AaE_013279 [Aphanomyces astaci]